MSIRRINQHLAEIDADQKAAAQQQQQQLRPNEAQLGWANFHRVARAQATQRRIERLMNFPSNISDVEGAHSSDGDSTVVDKDNDDYYDYDDDYDDEGCGEEELLSSSSSAKKMGGGGGYLGTRRDRQGKWVRRHFSRTRFPHLAKSSMSMQSSSRRQQTARSSSSNRCGRNQSTITKYTRKKRNTRQKIVISKGRRALLRVSARAYEDRKQTQPSSSSLFYSTPDDNDNNDYEFESIPTTSTFQSTNPISTFITTNTDFDYFHPIKNRQEAFLTNLSSSSSRIEDRIGNNNLTFFEEEDELLLHHGHYYTESPGGETKNRSAASHSRQSRSTTHSLSLSYNTTNANSQSTTTKSHNSSRLSSSSCSSYSTSKNQSYTSNNDHNFDHHLSKNRSEESTNENPSMVEKRHGNNFNNLAFEEDELLHHDPRTTDTSPGETKNNGGTRRRRSKRVTNARSTILLSLQSRSRYVSSSLHNTTATAIDDDDDVWNEAIDPISGETYYYNQATGESSWERPSSRKNTHMNVQSINNTSTTTTSNTIDFDDIDPASNTRQEEEEVFATKSSSSRLEKKIEKLAFESENELLYRTEINNRGRRTLRGITIATGSSSHSRHSSSIITNNDSENEDRIRRFQQAFNAIILATNANFVDQNDDDEASVSTSWLNAGGKRWRRDPNVSSAVSIDGRMYDDMQRAPTASFLKQMMNHPGDHAELMDRAATWLVHVPRRRRENNSRLLTSVTEENNAVVGEHHGTERGEIVVSACHQKLSDIESTIQEIENESNFVRMQNNLPTAAMTQGHGSSSMSSPLKRLSIQSNGEDNDITTPPLFGYARGERKLTAKFSKELMGIHSKERRMEGGDARSQNLTAKFSKELMGVDNSGDCRMKRGDANRGELTATNPSEEIVGIHPEDCRMEQEYSRRVKLDATHPSEEFMGVNSGDHCRIGEYDKNSNSNVEFTPSVGRISALKRLFAGVQKETFPSSKNHAPTMKTPVHSREPNPTMARGGGGDSNPSYMKRIYNKITVTEEKEIDANGRFVFDLRNEKVCVGSSSMRADPNEANATESDDARNNSLRLSKSKALGTVDCEETNKISCKNDDLPAEHIFEGQGHLHDGMFDSLGDQSHLNLENLIRESLITRLPSVIDTDGTESDVADLDEEQYAAKMRSMLMSPSLITKRYQQALTAIEGRNWTQISSLINANPWLMEMEDVRNDQSLVHSLSLFGGLQNDADYDSPENTQTLPEQLVQNIIDHIPNVVYKLDIEGNLPLHMAAASGNIVMIRELGRRFSGGASVQNHNGLLPLHLAIMSCALSFPTGSQSVELLLALFPGAVRVKDSDGNTPLHIAAGTLRGDVGADVIYQLMNECYALMVESEELHEVSMTCATPVTEEASTILAATVILPGESESDPSFFTVKNNKGEIPLTRAIKSLSGRQVVEALLIGVGGQSAALNTNSASQNALHLALGSEYYDAAVILSILKSSPTTATVVDGKGMLPIQVACLNSAQHEIVLAIAIVDLPIDLGAKEEAIMRDGFGESWWYLLCETDDLYVDVITEILLLCSHPQKVALCLTQAGGEDDSQIASTCATSQCKLELRRCLRFFGRFEFVGSGGENHVLGVQKFDAIDYGTREAPIQDGKKVNLYCYTDAIGFSKNVEHLQHSALDTKLFEELSHFSVGKMEANVPSGVSLQYCVAVDKPNLRLSSVMAGMPNNHKYRADLAILGRYFGKSRSIMRQIAKALRQLHGKKIIHGHVDSHHIGKFRERWKVIGLPGSAVGGEQFETSRLGLHSPPEAYVSAHSKHSDGLSIASLAPSLKAEPAVDIWAFGKLMYEILVGESLFGNFSGRDDSVHASKCILTWNDGHLREVSNKLFEERIGSTGVDLISCCLRPTKSARTRSMSDILQHPFWRDDNAFNLN